MNLCVDIGNTRIKLGVFDERNMVYYDVVDREAYKEIEAVLSKYTISRTIISSTQGIVTSFEEVLSTYDLSPRYLSSELKLPFKNTYRTPKTLGKDRIAVAAAAMGLFPNQNVLIVDTGTCVTYDVVDAEGTYHGGNISPGWRMRHKAMHAFTTSLPELETKQNKFVLGKDTTSAIQNGAFYGLAYEIEMYIRELGIRFPDLIVILSGGDANIFGEAINSKIFVRPNLVLEGLNEIIQLNE